MWVGRDTFGARPDPSAIVGGVVMVHAFKLLLSLGEGICFG